MVNVLVVTHPEIESVWLTSMVGLPVQLSVAVTKAWTLASSGIVATAGLQPSAKPLVGTLVITGGAVSVVQV
jgi:hypothetical protein